jgi:hypothetical protein
LFFPPGSTYLLPTNSSICPVNVPQNCTQALYIHDTWVTVVSSYLFTIYLWIVLSELTSRQLTGIKTKVDK